MDSSVVSWGVTMTAYVIYYSAEVVTVDCTATSDCGCTCWDVVCVESFDVEVTGCVPAGTVSVVFVEVVRVWRVLLFGRNLCVSL